jgi:hypothetical protein
VNERPQARELVQSLLLVLAAGTFLLDAPLADIHFREQLIDWLCYGKLVPGPDFLRCEPTWDAAESGIAYLVEPATTSAVPPGSEPDVDVVLRNDSDEVVAVYPGNYVITAYDEFDTELAPKETTMRDLLVIYMTVPRNRPRFVQPGEEKTETLSVSDWYDLTRPGRYKIVVNRCARLGERGAFSRMTSNSLEITMPEHVRK